jgi:Ca-activated chloride channel family protein
MFARSTMMVCAIIAAVLCGSVPADSMIIVTPRDGQSFPRSPVQLVEQKIDVTLTDRAAEVSVECVYHNSTNMILEGEWIFPLPPEAAVDKFSMFVGGEEIKAELLDAVTARTIYENIVRQTKDPALLEYIDRQLLRARIFPIEANSDAAVKLYYTHPITADFGVTDFVFPIVEDEWAREVWTNADIRAKSSLAITINTVSTLKSVTSPTHDVTITHTNDHHATVIGSADVLHQSGDFHLLCTYDSRDITAQFLSTENEDGKFFMGIIAPGNAEGLGTLPKDVVFCFDRSGSMQGEKIKQARDALKFCLGSLNPEDRFALLWFNDALDVHTTRMTTCDGQSIRQALSAVSVVEAEGGTFIYGALERALGMFEHNERPKYLVFLTDGLPTVGNTRPEDILQLVRSNNKEQARLFTFGVGYDLNAGLLNDLADQNGGFSSYVAPDEDVEVAVSNFFRKMSRPVLADCRLEFEPGVIVNDMYPSVLPDVFAGNEIIVFGRILNEGETDVHLHGTRGTTQVNHTFPASFAPREGQYPFIAKLWAGRRIGHLLDAMRTSGETAEVKDEVIRLSKRYGIMTPYTSFLAAPEEVRVAQGTTNYMLAPQGGVAGGTPQYSIPTDQSATTYRSIEASKLKSAAPAMLAAPSFGLVADDKRERDANVSGRRFTNLEGVWTDWDAVNPKAPATDTLVIKPYSGAYFHLAANKDIAAILSLGDRIIFLWGNVLIRIDESGAEKWNKDWPHL